MAGRHARDAHPAGFTHMHHAQSGVFLQKMSEAIGRTLFAFGAASAGALALWWLWQRKAETPPDLSAFQRPVARVSKLWFYPIKSCKGVELTSAKLGVRGLKYDR